MQIASHIQACELLDPQQPVLGHVHQFMEDQLWSQGSWKTTTSSNVMAAMVVKLGKSTEAQLLEIGVERRIGDALPAWLQDADALQIDRRKESRPGIRRMSVAWPGCNTDRAAR